MNAGNQCSWILHPQHWAPDVIEIVYIRGRRGYIRILNAILQIVYIWGWRGLPWSTQWWEPFCNYYKWKCIFFYVWRNLGQNDLAPAFSDVQRDHGWFITMYFSMNPDCIVWFVMWAKCLWCLHVILRLCAGTRVSKKLLKALNIWWETFLKLIILQR